MEYSKHFSLKMNREKSIFHFEKLNFELIGNSVDTTEYLAFGKAVLAGLYLKVKVYVTKLLSAYIIYKISHAIKEVYNSARIFIFLRIYLTLKTCHWSNFNSIYWIERGTKINSWNIFEGCYWKKKKKMEIHKHNWLKKLNSLKSNYWP